MFATEILLLSAARAMGASAVGSLTPAERRLIQDLPRLDAAQVDLCRRSIIEGKDPLGDALCMLRSPQQRRPIGATYTPHVVVDAMLNCTPAGAPRRIVDPGAGTGRFLVSAGHRFPDAQLVGVELDPVGAYLLRGHLAAAGLGRRATVVVADYREITLPPVDGPTLFIGNPPYVRHHDIDTKWKAWLVEQARALGLKASQLSGLHVHFYLATALLGKAGDYGAFITAAEWMDVNYGALVRNLFVRRLGGTSLHFLEPKERIFADADTTSAIACFEIGSTKPTVRLARIESIQALGDLEAGRQLSRRELEKAARWTPLIRGAGRVPNGLVELGELCRVHRGQVTGANRVWIGQQHTQGLPERVLYRSVTRARELFAAGSALTDASLLKRVIDIPADLALLPVDERNAVENFLRVARQLGADRGFIASHRRAWWSVGLRDPAPILATYMARRPPAFVRNLAGARHINIAHGLYPRDVLSARALDTLARYLSSKTDMSEGRTYAGGLTKFEPKEMERLLVPTPDVLEQLG